MLLLLMRHGIAEPLSEQIPNDFERPLTSEGRDRVHRAALGLAELVPALDILASSPKVRARSTGQIVRDVFGKEAPHLTEWTELMEDDDQALLQKLRNFEVGSILLCGHEPHLSRFASRVLTGLPDKMALEFKKAGVCALEIEFESQSAALQSATLQSAVLLWHMTPKALRKVGK
jgi:phosphohistidine phosphatase